jgi:hypothetical protein
VFDNAEFLLQHFSERPISIATFEGLDIEKRVSLFYKGIAFAAVLLLLFTGVSIKLKKYFSTDDLSILNGTSLAGFCLLFFQLIGADLSATIHAIFALQIICLAGMISNFFEKRLRENLVPTFTWSVIIAVSLFYMQWQLGNYFFAKNYLSLPAILVVAGAPLYILSTGRFKLNESILKASFVIAFLPLLSFLTVELFMIFNQHEIYLSPKIFYAFGVLSLSLYGFWLFRKKTIAPVNKTQLQILFSNHIPVLIAGISCLALYMPVVKPEIDFFEDANHVLPLHQWFAFGKMPFLDSFNSHALSDFLFGWLYAVFNGNDPMGVFVYDFIPGVLYLLVIYFFILKMTGDGFMALWLTLVFPYAGLLLPPYFNFVPLAALAFICIYEKQSVKNYTLFFLSLLFLILWRIDLGVSALVAGLTGLAFLVFFVPSFQTNKKNLITGLSIVLGVSMLLFLTAFIYSGNKLGIAINDVLAYTSSFQSYGINDLSYVHNMQYFVLYYVFPVAVLLTVIYFSFLIIRKPYKQEKEYKFILPIVFLGIFYFSNLQRGLVRHTMAEQWDTAFTSFAFLIISGIVLFHYLNKSPVTRFFVFFIACTVLISNYVFTEPGLNKNNFYHHAVSGLTKSFPLHREGAKMTRVKPDASNEPSHAAFSAWMKENFTDSSTFLDFSNTPMLYYFANRIVPNYFLQIPHTAHNEYLQQRFLEDLNIYDIPVVVFSNVPSGFWDNLDGIPNAYRHYRIAEYIYKNYKPAFLLSNHSIWLKKEMSINNATADSVSTRPVQYSLKLIPYYWGAYDANYSLGKIKVEKNIFSGSHSIPGDSIRAYEIDSATEKSTGNYISIRARSVSGKQTDIGLSYGQSDRINGSFLFTLKNDTLFHDYPVRVSSQYNWYETGNTLLQINPKGNKIEINKIELLKGD